MTPSEAKNIENLSTKVERGMGVESASRKPSVRGTNGRTTPLRRSANSVQALASKFDELNKNIQKTKRSTKTVPLAKVVVSRKPSISKYKRGETQTNRRRVPPKKAVPDDPPAGLNLKKIAETQRNVLQKVNAFERKESPIKNVPKVLVDIDIKEVPKVCDSRILEPIYERNCLTVKSAIHIFERGSEEKVREEKVVNKLKVKDLPVIKPKPVAAVRPVAAIKPILKKEESKTKLSPKDSLYRVKYLGMKRDILGETELVKNQSSLYKEDDVKKEEMVYENNMEDEEKTKEEKNKENIALFQQISSSKVLERATLPKQRNFARLLKPEEPSLKPNTSFLWSQPEPQKPGILDQPLPRPPENFVDAPLPLPPEDFLPEIPDDVSDETLYDDINEEDRYDLFENEKNQNSLYCISETLQFDDAYQYIGQKDVQNIYEDIQSVRREVYGDNNCYESIYNGSEGKSMSEVSSAGSGRSAYEKNNSLYGVATGLETQPCSSPTEQDATADDSGEYHVTLMGHVTPSSESSVANSSGNSDEWVEVSDSESEPAVYQVQGRLRKPRNGPGWSQKVRRRWSKLQKRNNQKTPIDECKNDSNDHLYETIGALETTAIPEQSETNDNQSECLYSGDACIDDFDSDNSDYEPFHDSKLPEVPDNGYNLTRSLKAAGRKLRKNLSMRKNDLSKSLKRFKRPSRSKLDENSFTDNTPLPNERLKDSPPPQPISPSTSDPLLSDPPPVAPPRPRLSWTFRPKPRPSSETDSDKSIFYLSLSDLPKDRRKSVRPNVPPPPPPQPKPENLYAECGLFDKKPRNPNRTNSLYTDSGLYHHQIFSDEPLYQFYTECVNQQARENIMQNYDSEGYEEINDYYTIINDKRRTLDIKNVNPNYADFDEPPPSSPVKFQPRTLWCELPIVVESCVVHTLTQSQKKLQEAKFEILTSEGSYMNSLNILENHFMTRLSQFSESLITKRDFKIIFSNILSVKKSAEEFLADLEACWKDNILLAGICEVVLKHAKNFQVYVKYCKNQICIYQTLRDLTDRNLGFEAALRDVEKDPVCQNLNIHSFLMLPMQRITRLPLLLGAVLARLDKDHDEFQACKEAFEAVNKVVQECDDEARKMEKCEEMLIISQELEFPREMKSIPLMTTPRFLLKRGQVTQLVTRDEGKLTFGRKFGKQTWLLFLFTDLLLLARKKSSRNYLVADYCPRNLVELHATDDVNELPVKSHLSNSENNQVKHLMLLTMLENHEGRTLEMILSFQKDSDRQRWLEAISPKLSENPEESIYEEWDCPQVIAVYEFNASQPDELALCIGDVVNVLKKTLDGWYQGERLRDGARGWFPMNHTQEISSPHVRAKNKKQRYQLLALSNNLVEQTQRRVK